MCTRSLALSVLVGSVVLACGSRTDLVEALGGTAGDGGTVSGPPLTERDADACADASRSDVGSVAFGCPVTLTTGPEGAQTLVLDATNVYWMNTVSCPEGCSGPIGQVMQCSKRGCSAPIVLATGAPQGLAVDATSVYWTDNGTLKKVAIGGGNPTTIAAAKARNIAVDATSVYFTTDTSIAKVPIGGGSPTPLVTGLASPGWIVVDAANVYWTDTVAGTVQKVPLGGGSPTTLARGQSPSAMALDSSNLYWTNFNEDGPGAMLMKVPIAGGNVTALASGLRTPYGIAVDAANVYWTSNFAVMSVSKEGGSPTTLFPASAYLAPFDVAVDTTSVYWTDFITGALTKLTLKSN
jgi:hypothetical protein